jgi:hypothetical protein
MFTEARGRLNNGRRTALDALLADWVRSAGTHAQAARNIQAENGSEAPALDAYLERLAGANTDLCKPAPHKIFERVGEVFALQGHEASAFKSAVFGRAVILEKFARYLQTPLDRLGASDTHDNVIAALRALNSTREGDVPPEYRVYLNAMRQTALGKRAVFATFSKAAPLTSPWPSPTPGAQNIRETIALGADPVGKEYILFAYRLRHDTTPRVPTTASPGWTYQLWFRPNPAAAAERHGWTEPLGAGLSKQPEIVHVEESSGSELVFPIHIAKP